MIEFDIQNAELLALRKQVRMLVIVVFGLGMLVLGLLVRAARGGSDTGSGWPQVSASTLQAKKIVLLSEDGRPVAILGITDGAAGLALFDPKGDLRVLVSAKGDRGYISLTGEDGEQSTYIRSGALVIGDDKAGGVLVQGPPVGGPFIRVFDNSGYSTQLGRSTYVNKSDGTVSMTSAASLMGSSKDKTSTWSLLNEPVFTPTPTTPRQSVASKTPSPKQPPN